MALIVGTIIGATAGTQDIESGVFRDLAATGRSRLALFASRVAGAWAVVLPILAVTAGLAAAGCVALAGSLAAPGAAAIAAGTAAVLVAGALSAAVAVGVSALVGSRGPVIGIMLAFYLAVQNLLLAMGFLGGARQIVPDAAIHRIGDLEPTAGVHVGLGAAILVVVGWSAITLGARRMAHQDPRDLSPTRVGAGDTLSACPRPFASWLGQPSPRMVDVALTVAVGVPVVGTTVASGAEQDRVLLGLLFGLAATLPLLVRRRWPFAVLAVTLAAAIADAGRRPVRVPDHGRALHDRLDPLVGGDDRRRRRARRRRRRSTSSPAGPSSPTTTCSPSASRAPSPPASGSSCAAGARASRRSRSAPSAWTASASCSPSARSPRSACGSPRSSTTSSRTT